MIIFYFSNFNEYRIFSVNQILNSPRFVTFGAKISQVCPNHWTDINKLTLTLTPGAAARLASLHSASSSARLLSTSAVLMYGRVRTPEMESLTFTRTCPRGEASTALATDLSSWLTSVLAISSVASAVSINSLARQVTW